MTLRDILKKGGRVCFAYKTDEKDWMGEAKISIFSGGYGMSPAIIVEIPTDEIRGGRKEFELNQLSEAIELYERLVFSKDNYAYKLHDALVTLAQENKDVDLDDAEDLKIVRKLQEQLQK
jgi:hypothetical protein